MIVGVPENQRDNALPRSVSKWRDIDPSRCSFRDTTRGNRSQGTGPWPRTLELPEINNQEMVMPRPATAVLATVLGFLSNVAIAQESCHRSGEKQ